MLPSKMYQMKVSQVAGSEANIGFERALMTSCIEMNSVDGTIFQFSDAVKVSLSILETSRQVC